MNNLKGRAIDLVPAFFIYIASFVLIIQINLYERETYSGAILSNSS
jgi:hypothetical protein